MLKYRESIESLLKHPDYAILSDINDYWDFEYDKDNLYEAWIQIVEKQYKKSGIPMVEHIVNKDIPD